LDNGSGACELICVGDVDNRIGRPAAPALDVAVPTLAGEIIPSVTRSMTVIRTGKHADALVGLDLVVEPWREGINRCGLIKA